MLAKFKLEKETKGTFRYSEVAEDDNPVIGALYIKKHALKTHFNTPPLKITVEVLPDERD